MIVRDGTALLSLLIARNLLGLMLREPKGHDVGLMEPHCWSAAYGNAGTRCWINGTALLGLMLKGNAGMRC